MSRRKHGRPKKAVAKRRATTADTRRPEPDAGTEELRARRTDMTGTPDLPDDLLGALLGRGLITPQQYTAGRSFADMVRLVRSALGLTEGSPAGLWRNILSASPGGGASPVTFSAPGAEHARRALIRFRRDLTGEQWQAAADAADDLWPVAGQAVRWTAALRRALDFLAVQLRMPLDANERSR